MSYRSICRHGRRQVQAYPGLLGIDRMLHLERQRKGVRQRCKAAPGS